jgi:protein-S-isoprenylcysteine O-methyltransferase Ste14
VLFLRALLAFLALPGIVAFLIPWLLVGRPMPPVFQDGRGFVPFLAGVGLLLWSVREFYAAGCGTLAPWSPPQRLVVTGPYSASRNPMYVAVVLILMGWALGFHSGALAIYAAGVAVAFHLRIVYAEEPWLARTHGEAWPRYRNEVPRWLRTPLGQYGRSSGPRPT